MDSIFLYGTLCHAPLLEIVAGCAPQDLRPVPGALRDHRVTWAEGHGFPLIQKSAGAVANGVVLRAVPGDARARLDFYELGFGYALADVTVETDEGAVAAKVYFPEPGLWMAGADWSLEAWVRDHWPLTRHSAREVMSYFGVLDGAELAARYPMIQTRAAAQLAAEREDVPARVRQDTGREAVEEDAEEPLHSGFFISRRYRLRHPLYRGGMSEWVTREVFVVGDAVTVLPYDPVRDRVMLIEQFRMGAYARGDRKPWMLEPVAGRMEGVESPELTGARESEEEAGLTIRAFEKIGSYYASPGYSTERFHSLLGLADLPEDAAGFGGLDQEHEDIRSHVLSFDAAMALLRDGEVDNGPLVVSLLWLERERARLRAEAGGAAAPA
ncbi:gamma-glutamylcyclotransferase [Marimonas lutisalis]|uniref:gamma-glutamylcyclotransferase n=1 Tax=Marimonas lutisalis TaxID=2545756 RepID=UPI0010F9D6D4|nr:gamma-glutamylcyclotransferase [Marimonas lutisalis]